jgi:cytochrome P450
MSNPLSGCPVRHDFNPFAPPIRDNPHPFFADARAQTPVFFSELLQAWVVARYEDVQALLKDTERFSSQGAVSARGRATPEALAVLDAGGFEDITVINLDSPEHDAWRRVFLKLFSQRSVARMAPTIREVAARLVDSFAHDAEVEFVSRFAIPLPLRTILILLGIPLDKIEEIKRWSSAFVGLAFGGPPEQQVANAHALLAQQEYLTRLVQHRRAEPQDDIITFLAQTVPEEIPGATDAQIAGLVVELMIAGNETTTIMLCHLLYLLLVKPERWDSLRATPANIPLAIEEVLRMEPAAFGVGRVTRVPVELGGITLPAGARILWSMLSANRDESVFADPNTFDIHRSERKPHLTFGRGNHFCPGAPLARLELQISLETLLERLPQARLASGTDFTHLPSLLRVMPELRLNLSGTP